jgi:GAF domain-containing protein/anti-sigma regulatory factor (Ser/Thr protein kinase)
VNDRAKAGRGARSAAAAGTTLLKSVCDRLPVGFALFDASFRLAAWNTRFAALRGYPRKLLKAGVPLESFVRFDAERGEYDEGAIDALTRTKLAALKRGRPAEREQVLHDGRCLRIACERVPAGGLLLTCEDVTELTARERQLAERTAVLARTVEAVDEALAQQAATSEILRVISRSPNDVQPVFDTIARNFVALCDSILGAVFRYENGLVHYAGSAGFTPEQLEAVRSKYPVKVDDRSVISSRVILARAPVHVQDILTDPHYDREHAATAGWRRMLGVPMLRDGEPLGAIVAAWAEAGAAPKQHEELLKVFADQAVIAIENVRLFNETKEALEQQTATAEILRVISESPGDLAPVFRAIMERATGLCDAQLCIVFRWDGERFYVVATRGEDVDAISRWKEAFAAVGRPGPHSGLGRLLVDRQPVHIPDILEEAAYREGDALRMQTAKILRARSFLAVPLLKNEEVIGAVVIYRHEVRPFSARQIDLVRVFADQAVIAIVNVRLFNELQARNRELTESLDQQTATAQILKVISSSPTDVQPVFDAIVKSGVHLFQGVAVSLRLVKGDRIEGAAFAAGPGCEITEDPARPSFSLDERTSAGRAVLRREVIHVPDVFAEDWFAEEGRKHAVRMGWRSVVAAPMLREGKALGAILVVRAEAAPFNEKEIALLRTFADQAVIAIENVRLFNELEVRNRDLAESLEQQTATAEILRVISNSPTDIAPVLDAVAENAARLCDANDVVVMMNEGDLLRAVKSSGSFGERFGPDFTIPITRGSAAGRAVVERATVQVADFASESDEEYPVGREHQRIYGNHGAMATPLLHGDAVLGVIAVLRRNVRPFSDRQSALLQTFADQAAIAIANVRLFNETKEALDRQTATSEILKVIASSPSDEQPVFDAIIAHAGRIVGGCSVNVSRLVGDKLYLAAYTKVSPAADNLLKSIYPVSATNARPLAQAVRRKTPFVVSDFETDPTVGREAREVMRARGFRSTAYVPILHGNVVYGVMHVSKVEPGPFADHWVNMLRTFADQAVIAIENVRLFNETKEALDQIKASAEVLQVISSSVADTKPVFDKILESSERLFEGRNLGICQVGDDGAIHLSAYHGPNREEMMRHFPVPLSETSGNGTAILQRRIMHYPDVEAEGVPDFVRRGCRIGGNRSILLAPMLWEGRGIGSIWVGRPTAGGFSEKEIALLKTFADQAVIAIQNARLFREIQEKSHQLESANQHKSAFLANMSHELRTPLNAVIGFSEMLAARYFGDLTEKQAEYVNDIHGSGKHLLSLINDILDLSKIEAGRMELELGEFDLRAALDNALTLVRERAQRGGVALRLDAGAAPGAFVGDERKLKQVVLNLLSNAVKFTPRGGTVSVAANQVDGAAEIAVSDTGAGIAPEDQEAIFEAFRQVGTDVTRKREGTGLGLALTRRFVELHGGTIRVESTLGKGSTFTVRLPIRHGE